MQTISITEDEFVEVYRPIRNHLDPYAAFDWGDGYGTMFETFGEEFDCVISQPPATIWTYLSGDSDTIVSGFHFVNRLGYFISREPVPEGICVLVPLAFSD